MTRLIFSTIALAAALSAAAPAFAQDTMSVKVNYADLNLASSAGARIFHHRLQNAVDQICGTPDWRDLATSAMIRKCQRETQVSALQAERQAMADVHRPTQLASATPAR